MAEVINFPDQTPLKTHKWGCACADCVRMRNHLAAEGIEPTFEAVMAWLLDGKPDSNPPTSGGNTI